MIRVFKSSLDSIHHGELGAPTGAYFRVVATNRSMFQKFLYSFVADDRRISRVRLKETTMRNSPSLEQLSASFSDLFR